MTWALVLSGVLGAGLFLLVWAQPLGRPRPELDSRLRRLSAEGRLELEDREVEVGAPMFRSAMLERTMRPVLEDAGQAAGALLSRLGVEIAGLDERLALGSPGMTAPQFRGQQLATGAVSGLAFPIMNALGVHPLGPWPVWLWVGAAVLGFAAPSWQLASRLRQRRTALLAELPVALDLFVIAVSAGLSPEQALVEAARHLDGVLGRALREVVREAGLGTSSDAEGLAEARRARGHRGVAIAGRRLATRAPAGAAAGTGAPLPLGNGARPAAGAAARGGREGRGTNALPGHDLHLPGVPGGLALPRRGRTARVGQLSRTVPRDRKGPCDVETSDSGGSGA